MKKQKCKDCRELKTCRKERMAWFFIVIGLMATISIRLVTILMNVDPFWGTCAWYIGIVGFILFFAHKYQVFKRRATIIDQQKLIEKLSCREGLNDKDCDTISIILCHIRSNRERINFLFIFIASFFALIIAIYLDFFK